MPGSRIRVFTVHVHNQWILLNVLTYVQSTLVISNSLISNNRLSRSENLVPVLTHGSTKRQQNIVEKRRNCSKEEKEEKLLLRSNFSSFPQYFQYIPNLGVKLHIHSVKVVRLIVFLSSAKLSVEVRISRSVS